MVAEKLPKPDWLKVRFRDGDRYRSMLGLVRREQLHTVCEEAHCPNMGECWNAGTATFMILGDVCTRSCGFCAVTSGRPKGLDLLEPLRLARTVEALRLDYAVITSVNRDDLEDGGASVFAACLRAIRHRVPECRVEVLIPDFEGNWDALRTVVEAKPVVLNHNTETVPRLYPRVRPKARYQRSLELLRRAKDIDPGITTKSGLMVGLGETAEEVLQTMRDLREHGCDLLTVGQYLRPDDKHLPVVRYWEPREYDEIRAAGLQMGFRHVEAGPLVRSSYHAGEQARLAGAAPGVSAGAGGSYHARERFIPLPVEPPVREGRRRTSGNGEVLHA
ncbi:MAG TPA: lipoyl synthase [Dehalococcoidia bacterium]|nr:lipoyl synthase [Dehalococcoidia bacterium]